jgi:aspartate/methionine/tyrosine aminotransferase
MKKCCGMKEIGFSEIKRIEAKVNSDESYISLSQGALKVGGIPIEIKNHLRSVLQTDKTDYYQSAWGILPLRQKIALYLCKVHGISLSYKNVLVSHGCMGAISTLLFLLLDRGDEVLLPEPTYPAYKNIVSVAGGNFRFVCLGEKTSIDVEFLEKSVTKKTKAIIISNPCNPTGNFVLKDDLRSIVDWCEKNKKYLIVDEAYDDYIFDDGFCSVTPFVLGNNFIIRTGSFSKSLSMSGWRIGYMVVPESLSVAAGVVQDAILNCPNVIAQHAVLYALDHPEFSKKFHKIVKRGRDLTIEWLDPLVKKGIFSFKKPKAGFYIFLKTNEKDSFELCNRILNDAKVGLIPGRAFGPSGAPFLRLCYAREHTILKTGIDRLVKFF